MPVYNGLPHIESTLQSVLDQSFGDFEILIRDDRSTDGTFEWLLERYGRDPRFRLRQNSVNLNVGGQYNLLFSEARGDYILKLDADDIILPDTLETLVRVAKETGGDFIGGGYEWLDTSSGKKTRPAQQQTLAPGPLANPITVVLTQNPYSLCFSIWRRSLLSAMRRDGQFVLFTETCDWECQLRIALTGASFVTVKDVVGLYRIHATNRSAVTNAQTRSVIGDVLPYWCKVLDKTTAKPAFRNWLLRHFIGYLRNIARHPSAFSTAILAGYTRLFLGRPRFPTWTLSDNWRAELDAGHQS